MFFSPNNFEYTSTIPNVGLRVIIVSPSLQKYSKHILKPKSEPEVKQIFYWLP